jgi:hypothetical protein
LRRERYVAAFASMRQAISAGSRREDLSDEIAKLEDVLGSKLVAWQGLLGGAQTLPPPSPDETT